MGAAPAAPLRWRDRPADGVALAVIATATVAGVLAWTALGEREVVGTVTVVFASIAVEALPFVLLGALVSGTIAVAAPDALFDRIATLPLRRQVAGAMACGVALPVCECGSVPVARRLMLRGLHPSAAIAFMLAAPIVNPIVLGSTWVAYQGRAPLDMVLGRLLLGLTVAGCAAVVLARHVTPRPDASGPAEHQHHGGVRAVLVHAAADLVFMGRFVVAGALVAAIVQVAVPPVVLSQLGEAPILGPLAMMGLAVLLSLCSEADAFVAVSFVSFDPAAQLAFLVLGPVLDIKLAFLYTAAFGRTFVVWLAVVAIPITLAGALVFQRL